MFKTGFVCAMICVLTLCAQGGNAQVITTIAGNGNYNFSGDGGPATLASFNLNELIATDASGNLYVADLLNNRVRMVNTSGIISTFAGNGMAGHNGDGGPALAARVGQPGSVACSNAGVYIGELYNYICLVDPSGTINVVAGDGTGASTGDGGPAINAQVSFPGVMISDASGNIYFADDARRIRMINTAGIINTIAGSGLRGYSGDGGPATSAQLSAPSGIAIDAAGNIYISDYDSSRIRKVNTSGIISTIAGTAVAGFSGDGGPAAAAQIHCPTGIVVDVNGNIYFSDAKNYRIRKIDPSGIITTFAGTGNPGFSGDGGPALLADMYPGALVLDNEGNILVNDQERVRKICMGSSIYITVSPNDTICTGDNVTFTATTNNAGPSPTYQWLKNNLPVGNNNTYSSNNISDGDVIRCVLTSINPSCSLTPTDTSNSITMAVYNTVTPTISIAASPSDSICTEYIITYTASISNGGPSPVYQWYENASPVGSNTNTYTPNQINGNVISCKLTNNGPCASPQSVTSTPHTMSITPATTPQVSVSANPSTTITQNQSVTFTATVTNATNPQYQWKKNAVNIAGANQQTYTTNTLQNGDIITCRVRGLSICDTAYSAAEVMTVWPLEVANVENAAMWLNVWPNPVKDGDLSLSLSEGAQTWGAGTYVLRICDVVGKELMRMDWDGKGVKHIDMKGLASGLYMLHFTNTATGIKRSKKIVKE